MRLAIDAVGAKHGGAATVAKAVAEAALASSRVDQVFVFTSPRTLRRFDLPVSERLVTLEVPGAEGPAQRIAWQVSGLARAVEKVHGDALLCLSGGGRPPAHIPGATFIQQSLPFLPEALARLGTVGRLRMRWIARMMATSVRACERVLVQTQTMAAAVGAAYGLPRERVKVVGTCSTLPERGDHSAPQLASMWQVGRGKRVLYVGNASPYKNLEVLGPALALLRKRDPAVRLFGTLPRGHALTYLPGVARLDRLGAEQLRGAYELADVLVMPSLAETVGLPMIEAGAAGVPVVAADRPYAHEICGHAALYFDPLAPAELADALWRVLRPGGDHARLAAAGLQQAARHATENPYGLMVESTIELATASSSSSKKALP